MALKIKILDTAAGIAMFKELGLMDAANAMMAGDYSTAFNIFFNNLGNIMMNNGVNNVLQIIFKYAIVKTVLNAVPGTGKSFDVLGIVEMTL